MKILIFLHGTIIMHKNAYGKSRKERVKQSVQREASVLDYINYVPIGNSLKKIQNWKKQGAKIIYLSSHKKRKDVIKDEKVLNKYHFPKSKIYYRNNGRTYADILEKVKPDLLIEDDCESIGGKNKMAITEVNPSIKKIIKLILTKEFYGINFLPDNLNKLVNY